MANTNGLTHENAGIVESNQQSAASDLVLDGLFTGLLAGIGMGAALALAAAWQGEAPVVALERFSLEELTTPLAGGLVHLAVSGVYGLLFGLILQAIYPWMKHVGRGGILLAGLAYGLVLFALAWLVLLPEASPLRAIPPLTLAVAHGIYGLILGWGLGRG